MRVGKWRIFVNIHQPLVKVFKSAVFNRLPSHDSLAGAMKLKIKKSEGLTAVAFDDYEMFLYHSYVPHEAAAELSEVGNL